MANVRWRCPECGKGVNAPSRLRKLDPRRFCLGCSAKPGTKALVERECPSRERSQAKSAAKRATKALRAKAKQSALPYAQRHADIQKDFRKLLKLPEWRKAFKRRFCAPTLVKIRNRRSNYVSGHCEMETLYITVTVGFMQPRADVIDVLLHEMAHAYAGASTTSGPKYHGPQFWGCLEEVRLQAHEAGLISPGEYDRIKSVHSCDSEQDDA